MDFLQPTGLLLVAAIFFGAGVVKGILGMGLPTFAMGLLGLMMPVPQAAGLLTVPSTATNVWQAVAGGALRRLLRRLWTFQLAIMLGVGLAALLPFSGGPGARMLLGVLLVVYGITGLAGWRPRPPKPQNEAWIGPLVGGLTGVITGITGVFVMPAVPYLQSLGMDRNELTQALGMCFLTAAVALAVQLVARGELGLAGSIQSALGLLPALAGMAVGQRLRRKMSEAVFRRCFLVGMVGLGGWLVLH